MAPEEMQDPVRDGRFWLFEDGTRLPIISGGAVDDGDDGGDDGGDGGGADDKPAGGGREDKPPTKDDVDKLQAALKKERANSREADKLRSKLKEFEDRDKDDATKRAEAEQSAKTAETKALRLEVALEKGLSKSDANRLQGSTRDELEADADVFLKEHGGANRKPDKSGSFDAGARGSAGGSTDFNSVIRKAAGR